MVPWESFTFVMSRIQWRKKIRPWNSDLVRFDQIATAATRLRDTYSLLIASDLNLTSHQDDKCNSLQFVRLPLQKKKKKKKKLFTTQPINTISKPFFRL